MLARGISILTPAYVTLFWFVMLFLSIRQKPHNRMLVHFMGYAFFLYFSHAVYFSGEYLFYSYLDGLYIICSLSVYPIFYIYVRHLVSQERVGGKAFIHFVIPTLLGLLQYIWYIALPDGDWAHAVQYRNMLPENGDFLYKAIYYTAHVARFLFALQVVIYLFLVRTVVLKYRNKLQDYLSNTKEFQIRKLTHLSIILVLMALTSFTLAMLGRDFFTHSNVLLLVPSLLVGVLLFNFGYIGYKLEMPDIPSIPEETLLAQVPVENNNKLEKRLLEYFEEEKPFLYPELKIWEVSNYLGTNRTYVSRIIKEHFHQNFCGFVNFYRIEEAKRLLTNPDYSEISLDTLAEKSGFGSLASFIRIFKEATGKTPGSYRKHAE